MRTFCLANSVLFRQDSTWQQSWQRTRAIIATNRTDLKLDDAILSTILIDFICVLILSQVKAIIFKYPCFLLMLELVDE